MIVPWYHRKRYGQELSYKIGMEWLEPCDLVEDWGCALAYAKNFRGGPYRGIDGTAGAADVIADLSIYTSKVEGIHMRGILEHNHDWRVILDNAIDSFTKRMSLMIYVPMQEHEELRSKKPVEIALPAGEMIRILAPFVRDMRIVTGAAHGYETVFLLEKPAIPVFQPFT